MAWPAAGLFNNVRNSGFDEEKDISLLSGTRKKRSRSYLEQETYKYADSILEDINELILGISRNSNTERHSEHSHDRKEHREY